MDQSYLRVWTLIDLFGPLSQVTFFLLSFIFGNYCYHFTIVRLKFYQFEEEGELK